jgi:hypothetical protein
VLYLGAARAVHRVHVEAARAGWAAEIHLSDQSPASFSSWGAAYAGGTDLAASHTFRLPSGLAGRYVLLWITGLPPASSGERQSQQIAEVTVG